MLTPPDLECHASRGIFFMGGFPLEAVLILMLWIIFMGLTADSAGFNPSGLAGFMASPKRIEPETSGARQSLQTFVF